MSRPASRVAAALVLGALAGLPAGAGAQYVEPAPRVGGVPAPPVTAAGQAEEARRLGIRPVDALVADAAAGRARIRSGTLGVVVIPALFSDSPEPHVSSEEIRAALFDDSGAGPSLTDFYAEASRGRLTVEGEVPAWVRTGVSLEDAAGEVDGHGWIGPDFGAYVVEAVRAADPAVDFGAFDDDGPDGVPNSGDDDGVVDALAVQYLEVAGSCGGAGPWPHLGTTRRGTDDGRPVETDERTPSGEPIVVDPYIAESATDCSGEKVHGIQVIAHELGHVLGLPDYYEPVAGIGPDGRHWTVGCFGLMGAGAWGCGAGEVATEFGPAHFSPLSLLSLGWAEPVRVERARDQEFVLDPVRASGQVLVVPLAPGSPEAFHLEYRTREGYDTVLPAEGVLVYHHDAFDGERAVEPGEPPPYPYHLVEADADHALRKIAAEGGDRGVAADVFAVDGGPATLDAGTSPSTRGHSGRPSTLTIHEIRVEGGRARIRLTVGSELVLESGLPSSWEALQPLDTSVGISGGSPPFTARVEPEGALPPDLELSVENSVIRIRGTPVRAGRSPLILVVGDAEGGQVQLTAGFRVEDPAIPVGELIEELVAPDRNVLSRRERRYLDLSGNGNGAYDLGDLRARVQRTGRR